MKQELDCLPPEPKRRLTDDEYKFVYERAVRFGLDFIVVKNGQVLLAKRDIEPYKGYWSFVGGVMRRKESIDEAAERILFGELGLKPKSKKMIGYMEFPDEVNQNGIQIHTVSIAFAVELGEGEIKNDEQANSIQYFTTPPEKDLHPIHGKFLKENWEKIIEKD